MLEFPNIRERTTAIKNKEIVVHNMYVGTYHNSTLQTHPLGRIRATPTNSDLWARKLLVIGCLLWNMYHTHCRRDSPKIRFPKTLSSLRNSEKKCRFIFTPFKFKLQNQKPPRSTPRPESEALSSLISPHTVFPNNITSPSRRPHPQYSLERLPNPKDQSKYDELQQMYRNHRRDLRHDRGRLRRGPRPARHQQDPRPHSRRHPTPRDGTSRHDGATRRPARDGATRRDPSAGPRHATSHHSLPHGGDPYAAAGRHAHATAGRHAHATSGDDARSYSHGTLDFLCHIVLQQPLLVSFVGRARGES